MIVETEKGREVGRDGKGRQVESKEGWEVTWKGDILSAQIILLSTVVFTEKRKI